MTVVADASSPPAEAGVDGAGPTSVEECRSLYDRAQILAEEAWQRARKDCRADEDCVLASRSGCITDCGAFPIATASLPEWKKAHDELESTTCKRFWDGDCLVKVPVATPTCEAYRAVCVHGQCVAK